jgi:hypothetical protein
MNRLAIHHPRRGGSGGIDPGGASPEIGDEAGGFVTVLKRRGILFVAGRL